jgi:hypothetical protein
MTISRAHGTTSLSGASFPSSDPRVTFHCERRIEAMEARVRDAGLPNDRFPFMAAWCGAHPEWNTLRENYNHYDAVCVLKGLREVALLPAVDFDRSDPFHDHLLCSIERAGLVVRESPYASDLIVGSHDRVDAVEQVFRKYSEEGRFSDVYHRELGQALGYSEKAIERFLIALSRNQSSQAVNIIESALPTDDDSYLLVRLPNGHVVAVC